MNLGILALTLPLSMGAPVAPPAMPVPAPFLFVKLATPKGSKVTWYPGTIAAAMADNDAHIGLRPGYTYRVEVSEIPGVPGLKTVYPSIEVRGTLMGRENMNVYMHPVPLSLTFEDLQRIAEGRCLSKVYYLEDPQQAVLAPTKPGEPFEMRANTEEDAIKESQKRGRLVIIFRAGERSFTPMELERENVPGTILFPGSKTIPMPAAPPRIAYGGIPLYDPLIGPNIPGEECLHDGGDQKQPLGIGPGKKLTGLDPSDTAMEFSTSRGRQVIPSNRVCICIPKFAALTSETVPLGHQTLQSPEIRVQLDRQLSLASKHPPRHMTQVEQPIEQGGFRRPSGMQNDVGLLVKTMLVGRPSAVVRINGLQVVSELRETEDLTVFPGCLALIKRMDPPNPQQIGEEVTFYLRYNNPTQHGMTDVVISDSLTGRLEYIPGTAKSTRPATFTTVPNEAGSVILRWAIDGKLLPGESGVVAFRARIR